MRTCFLAAATAAILIGTNAANAQDDARYWVEKSGDGYIRMDRATGEMSFCEEADGRLVCRVAADERRALRDEIDALQDRIDGMEERLAALEGRPGVLDDDLPSEEEFEKTMGYMERFFRRFMGIVKDLERDFGADDEEDVSPGRT